MMIRRSISIALVSVLAGALGMFTFAAPISQTTGTWHSLGSLVDARQGASATMLDDGRVLIAGGSNATGLLASAEVVSADGSTVAVAAMNLARTGHTATKLRDGRVLVTGGTGAGSAATASAEIFAPWSGTWTPASMTVARRHHTATLVRDESGLVVIAGGENAGGVLSSVEVFDPASGAFAPLATAMSSARTHHAAAPLPDGQVIVIGGSTGASVAGTTDIVNALTGAAFAGPSMTDARKDFTATELLNGDVLVVGGVGGANGTTELAAAEKLVVANGVFIPANGLPGPRHGHQAVRLPGNAGVLVVGGTAFGQPLRTVDLFLPESQVFRMTSPTDMEHTAGALAPVGTGLVVAAGGTGTAAVETYAFATITTDADDYAPGSLVTMTGTGWAPNEPVTLVLRELQQLHPDRTFTALADGLGNIINTDFIPEEHHLGVRFYLTATQGASEAQHTFTDSRTINSVTLDGGTSVTVAGGATIAAVVNATTDNGGGNNDWQSTRWRISTSPTTGGTTGCVDHADHTTSGTFNELFSVSAPASGGPYNAYFIAFADNSCSSGASSTFTLSNSVTIDSAVPTVSTINRAAVSPTNSTTVSWTVTFSESVTGVDATDFSLDLGGVAGASITGVSGSGATRTVTADSGSGTGTLRLDVVDDDTVLDTAGSKLGGAGTGNGNFTTGQAYTLSRTLTPTFTADSKVYDGNNSATILTRSFTSPLPTAGFDLEVTGGTATFNNKNVGNGKTVTAAGFILGGDDANRFLLSSPPPAVTATANITKADAVCSMTGYNVTYDGNLHTATGSCLGVEAETLSGLDLSTTTHTNAGNYPADPWTFTDSTGNYNNSNGTVADAIAKASASFTVTPYNVTYDGQPHTATVGTINGVNGETGAAVGTINLASTTHTNAGTYTGDGWTFTGSANYNDQTGTVNDAIAKATASFTVTPYNVTYDGQPHTATVGTISGVNGETGATVGTINLGGTTHTNAGTYTGDTWTFTGTANYNDANGTVDDAISKANVSFTVTPYNVTYDGQPHTATVGTISGVNGETGATVGTINLSGTTHTNAGTYTGDAWTFTGGTNYNDQAGTVDDAIGKANASFTVTPYNVTYDGLPHTATVGTISGVNGETGATVGTINLSGTTHTNAGTYAGDAWTFTGTANYNDANGTVDDAIGKANASFTVTPYNVTYDGQPHTATVGTIGGVNGETGATVGTINLSGTTHTNAGTYAGDAWTFTGTANYNDANGTVDDAISKANASFTVTPYNVTYDGQPHTATVGTISGVNGETGATVGTINLNGTTHTNAGTYAGDSWTFTGGTNYNDANGTVDDAIGKANASFTVTPYNVTYDGQPHTATVGTISGVNGETGATVGTLNLSGTTHTNAGTYAGDAWTFTGGTNYNDQTGTVDDAIGKANASFTVTPYNMTYDGQPHTATVGTISGVNGETGATVGTLNLSGTTHTNAGTYAGDSWSFTGGTNYNDANGTVDDAIGKANASFTVTPYNVTYDGQPHTATVGTISGVNGETGATVGTINLSGTTHTNAGTYAGDSWTFIGGTNYNDANGTVDDAIGKANATFTVTPYNVTYDGQPHTSTVGTISGVNGETGATVGTINLNGTTHTNAGTYAGDSWSFTGGTNYNDANGTVDDAIGKANASFTVTPYNVTYDGQPHTATVGTIGGVNGETGATVGTINLNGTTHTNAGTYAGDSWSFTGGTNYNDANGTIDDAIDEASSTTLVTCPANVTYTGSALTPCAVTVTGVGGLNLTPTPAYLNNTNAGIATASYTFSGDANHDGSNDSKFFTIDQAASTTAVTCGAGPFTYNGNAHTPCSVTVTGASLSLTPTPNYVNNTNAGAATASYTYGGDANHTNSADSENFTIGTKNANVAAQNKSKTFGAAMAPDQSAPGDFTVTGIVGTDQVSNVTLTSPGYAAGAAAGSHTIAPSNATGAGLSNYTISYTNATLSVTYASGACVGSPGRTILQPINPDGSSVFKQKSTAPAKFRVCDANGNSVGLAGTVTGFAMIMSSNGTYSEASEAPDSTTPDTAFRWSAADQQWIFNISTKSLAANKTYLFRISLADGTFIDFAFGLK